jgi:hypothetical protein
VGVLDETPYCFSEVSNFRTANGEHLSLRKSDNEDEDEDEDEYDRRARRISERRKPRLLRITANRQLTTDNFFANVCDGEG